MDFRTTALAALIAATPALTALAETREGPRGFSFEAADADGDGAITAEELQAFQAAQSAGLDADGDGFLTEAELTAQYRADAEARIATRVARQIAAADGDGDGRLSAAELALGRHAAIGQRLFRFADSDGDGAVSRAEFDAARERMAERVSAWRGRRNP